MTASGRRARTVVDVGPTRRTAEAPEPGAHEPGAPEPGVPRPAPPTARSNAVDLAIWAAALLAIAGTLWFSLASPGGADALLGSDKVGHALAYAVDTLLLLFAVVWRPGRPQPLVAWVVPILLGVASLGGAVELAQVALGRDADPLDWAADLVGVAVATFVFARLRRRYGAAGT